METQIFHHAKIYLIFKKQSVKRNKKILQDIIITYSKRRRGCFS
jgi:hypothetical protein